MKYHSKRESGREWEKLSKRRKWKMESWPDYKEIVLEEWSWKGDNFVTYKKYRKKYLV